MGGNIGSRLMLWEATSTINYGLNSVGDKTECCQAVMLLCPLY